MFNSEDKKTNDSDSDVSNSNGSSPPKKKRKRTINKKSFKKKVLHVLRKGTGDVAVGEFVISGKLENAPISVISVKNTNKVIRCPLYENDADGIIALFEQSPYGKGSETVVDTSVRNSWQLSPDEFKILNPNWNTFIETVLKPRIITEMMIQTDFEPSLYKLLLYKAGSFFKPHRDSEKEEGMFATLVVQLPSKYAGGQLVVNHDEKKEIVDFSSTAADCNEFSTFYSVFYCDCEHEILPVTEGYRLCLIYNLISKKSDCIPVAPTKHVLETELVALLKSRNTPWKLVYALQHKYSKSNLSYESLKTTDKCVANFLRSIVKTFGLNIYLAIFNKESLGQGQGDEEGYEGCEDADFDSNDENLTVDVSYVVNTFKPVIGPAMDFNLNVDFDNEVIPEKRIDNIKPYRKTCEPTGNAGIDVSKYYRSAAIVFWPEEHTLQVLLAGRAPVEDVDAVFLGEIEKYRSEGKYSKDCKHLIEWATTLVKSTEYRRNNIPLINAILAFDSLQLVQSLFQRCVTLNPDTIPLLLNQCEKYGWISFSDPIAAMLNAQSIKDSINNLNLLVENEELGKDKNEICHSLLKSILARKYSIKASQYSRYFSYGYQEMMKQNQELLYSIGVLAQKVGFTKNEIIEIVKKEPLNDFVSALLRLLSSHSNVSNHWMDIATHVLVEMEKETAKPVIANSWMLEIPQDYCTCIDCVALHHFMRDDKQFESFKIIEKRRKHFQSRVSTMQYISEATPQKLGQAVVFILKKTKKSGYLEMHKRNISLGLLEQLRSAMPK